ncbi:MAG: hypothetical protein JWM26_145, partial [Betaproteobacteria bacterium]|nr:hypothetical protein [Betaproteobacteria bacterium]
MQRRPARILVALGRAASRRSIALAAMTALLVVAGAIAASPSALADRDDDSVRNDRLDEQLNAELKRVGFSGTIESTLEARLKRRIDDRLADLGRLLFFDTVAGLHDDNTCAGCHSPTNGFGDTQSIAIGVQNNNLVGPDRAGPRNQR